MMKELKMFPQITEETEENLNLEEDVKDSTPSSTPPLDPSSESPADVPSSPNYENQVPCPLPIITTEDVDKSSTPPPPASTATPTTNHHHTPPSDLDDLTTSPPRVRMRSLSGGAYRLAPTLPATGRIRRQSGDDVLTRVGLFEHFRPRSKSDSKGKKPTFLASLKNSFFQRKNSLEGESPPPQSSLEPPLVPRQRSRSGSETRGGTMSKMIDMFRSRSNSVSIDSRVRKQSAPSAIPANALLRRYSVDPEKRRKPINTYRSLDGHQGEPYACHAEDDTGDSRIDYGSLDDDKIIPTFLSCRTCYNAMPKSGKVILLSTDLLVKNAFNCLLTNEIRAAPLWDSTSQSFVGILTITDFISVLRHYYYFSSEDIKDIENQQIQTWRRITNVTRPFVKIGPNESLAEAAKLLIQEGVHRLPVYDDKKNSVLSIITRRRLLQYLHQHLIERFEKASVKTPSFMKKTLGELKLGTYEDVAQVSPDTTVIEALDLFVKRKVSALPVTEDSRLVNIYAKFDVFALAKEQTYHNLDMTISDALSKTGFQDEIYWNRVCAIDTPLETIIDRFVSFKIHRLVVINDKNCVIGIVSLSDILKFIVLQPLALLNEPISTSNNDTIAEAPEGAVGGESDSSKLGSPSDLRRSSSSSSNLDPSTLSEDLSKLQVLDAPSRREGSSTSLASGMDLQG